MTPAQRLRKVQYLWEKFAAPDKHGYRDLMRKDAFEAACGELMAAMQLKQPRGKSE